MKSNAKNIGLKVSQVAARVRSDLALALLDLVLATGAYLVVLMLRFDGAVPPMYWRRFQNFIPVLVLVHLTSNLVWGLYRQMWRHASVAEARRVILAGISALAALETMSISVPSRLPQSVIVLGTLVVTVLTGVVRFQSRLFALHRRDRRRHGQRVLILGAGEAGAIIAREMARLPDCGYVPVAFLDDDPRKQGRILTGLPVVGTLSQLALASERHKASQAVLAIPSASPEVVDQVAHDAEFAGVVLKVLPPVAELLSGRPTVRDVRDLQIEDLLGRHQVTIDLESVHRLLEGRRVLITGAGGSIGSEIARQVAQCRPSTLVLVDHDETHLHDAVALLDTPFVEVLADVRDRQRVNDIFECHRPDVVFHAAAHKHVPILERHPCEAIRTNVAGTANVAAAAARIGVEHLVFISTDKAVRPRSVMGATKWLGEQLILRSTPSERRWCSVRFGNVVGSRGSVIPTFTRQILAGGPVTVTDRRMTRFFMSVQESVQLVLQSAVFAQGGEVFMLDMGQPVNIYELAERMIRLSERDMTGTIGIEITGVRPGEKLVEELRTEVEEPHPTGHPAIVCLHPTRLSPKSFDIALATLFTLMDQGRDEELARRLFELNGQQVHPGPDNTEVTTIDLRNLEPSNEPRG